MLAVVILGLLINAIALPLAARRVFFLYKLISSGQPAPDRIEGVTSKMGTALKRQVVEVFGQKKLLQWSIPGVAHFFVFWAFIILGSVYAEAYGSLIERIFHIGETLPEGFTDWSIPIIGQWAVVGFVQDFIAVMCLLGIWAFAQIRLKNAPSKLGRDSRFSGSHLSGAWITLFMIFNVIWTLFLFRGASSALGRFPYENGAFVSIGLGKLLDGFGETTLEVIEGIGLLLHIGVMLVFLIFVLNSKHLHIFLAPLNVLFGREPKALGAVKPLMIDGKPVSLEDIDDLDEDSTLGVGQVEDFSWKGILDFNTCTECGRCQDQCPAWNTEKPLSPKLLIMALRDSTLARAPYSLADEADREKVLAAGGETLTKEVERPLVAKTPLDYFYMPEDGSGVIDPDVLWSCVTCGACVEQCPVDIEHVDHIIDMRRYQVLVENNFPAELNQLFKGMEGKGNPWNMSPTGRMDWAKDLDFEVKVVGETIESLDEVEWLFWVGCAGAYEDRAKKTTRAVAELLNIADVSFGVLGNGETCTGDQARRAGNEFIFQGLAMENVETFKQYKVKKVVSTCAHCFNTLKNEYSEFGVELEVVHHTQLLNRLVREGKLTPVKDGEGAHKRSITYHDPCYVGRHNGVYSPPRELLEILPGASYVEMPRNSERSFCCGAGGARMWMEETIGSRINENRSNEAIETGADQIAVGCPFCRVMLSDGLTSAQDKGSAREEVEVLDVAQMLLASVKGVSATKILPGGGEPAARAASNGAAVKAEPEAGDVTITEDTVTETADAGPAAKASGGSSLFDTPAEEPSGADTETAAPEKSVAQEAQAAKPASSGGSLFDVGGDEPEAAPAAKAEPESEPVAAPEASDAPDDSTDLGAGGSLFDVGGDEPEAAPAAKSEPAAAPATEAPAAESKPAAAEDSTAAPAEVDLGAGGSLFDVVAEEPAAAPAAKAAEPEAPSTEPEVAVAEPAAEEPAAEAPEPKKESAPAAATAAPSAEIPDGGSLFDIAAPEAAAPAAKPAPAESTESVEAADSTESADSVESAAPVEDDSMPQAAVAEAEILEAEGTAEPTEEAGEPAAPEESPADDASAAATEAAPEEAPEVESAPEPAAEEKPKPTSSGEAHTPKTDVDLDGGSLFDL
ncbi:hypothetical protein GCM10027020_34520 [Nocardioides salsibiostraticola]